MQKPEDTTIKQLYPELPDADLKEVEDNLERYLGLVVRVYDRIAADPEALTIFREVLASDEGLDHPTSPSADSSLEPLLSNEI